MFDFFQVIDAEHDDPTVYPVLSAPDAQLPFEWEPLDGQGQPSTFTTKSVAVHQFTGSGWTRMHSFTELSFNVVVTESRVVVYCEKFVKGGGWRGFGAGGLAFAAVANAVSHARAAARRKGKLLVGQVRYPWLVKVAAPPDKRARRRTLRLVVNAGSRSDPRLLALDLGVSERLGAINFAQYVAYCAAAQRVDYGELSPADAQRCHQVAGQVEHSPEPLWDIPAPYPVGELPTTEALPALPAASTPAATTSAVASAAPASGPSPDRVGGVQAAPTAALSAHRPLPSHQLTMAPVGQRCPTCGHPVLIDGVPCGRCGRPGGDKAMGERHDGR